MKPIIKNILIGASLLLVGFAVYGKQKVSQIQAIFDQMTIKPVGFSNVNFSIKAATLSLNLDIKLSNNTVDGLYVTGLSLASLDRLIIYYKGILLGEANVNIGEISIPAYSYIVLNDIPVTVDAINILDQGLALLSFNINDLTIVGEISALGTTYQIAN